LYRRKLRYRTPEVEVQKNHKLKLLIITALCAAAIILFYFYTTLNDDNTIGKNAIYKVNYISREDLSKDIDSVAYTFGIHKDWIINISQKIKKDKSPGDSLLISKEIWIPSDIPMIDLNFEFSNYLRSNLFKEKVTEDPKTKNIFLEIYPAKDTAGKLAGTINFVYNNSLKRDASDVCLILDSIEVYPLDNVQNILGSTEEFSVFLPLRNDKADYQSMVMDSKRDYLLKFSIGDENNVIADFKSDMKESVWKAKVKSASINFPNSSGIIMKTKTGFNEFENEVREEFEKNNMTVYIDSLFSQHIGGEQTINWFFSDIISKSNSGKNFLFYTVNFSPDVFNYFDREVYKLKKLGYKFLNFKDMIKKINKTDIHSESNNSDTKK